MQTRVIRYTTKPELADENDRLVRRVFAELAATNPGGLRYQTFRLDDGNSFLHIVDVDPADNPLLNSAAFSEFQADIQVRCSDGPVAVEAVAIGSYPVH